MIIFVAIGSFSMGIVIGATICAVLSADKEK